MPRFQNGSLMRMKRKSGPDAWVFRWYDESSGKRTYRKRVVGTVDKMPLRRDAERSVAQRRVNINREITSPDTVRDLIAHYKTHELTEDAGKRSSTREVYTGFLDVHIDPQWGETRLDQVRTVAVEKWLRSLELAPGTKAKIRNIMSALFAHANRHEMIASNPIRGVRCSAKREREPDVLLPAEFALLLSELPERERVMVLIAGTTGVRRSELIALKWKDIDFGSQQIMVTKSCVRAKMGETKTVASAKPVPMHPIVAVSLQEWHRGTPYGDPGDFLFPSLRRKGLIPVWPDMVLQNVIRPALKRAGVTGKRIGFHTFRHSLATNLRSLGVDIKTAQELLRHANSRITLDLYTQAISSDKQAASNKVVEMFFPAKEPQHPSAPMESKEAVAAAS